MDSSETTSSVPTSKPFPKGAAIAFFVVVAFLILVPFLAREGSRPSEAQVRAAVEAALQREVPISWVGNVMGGRNARIYEFEIKTWGSYQERSKCWPVRARVKGIATLKNPINLGKSKAFERVGEFDICKDDFGDWKAKLRGGILQ